MMILRWHYHQKFIHMINRDALVDAKIKYNQIIDILLRQNLRIDINHALIQMQCDVINTKNINITFYNAYSSYGSIQMQCTFKNHCIYCTSKYSDFRFDPINFIISSTDRVLMVYDCKNKKLQITSNNLLLTYYKKILDVQLYSEGIRGSCAIDNNTNNKTCITSSIMTMDLNQIDFNKIKYLIYEIKKIYSIYSDKTEQKNIDIYINVNHCLWKHNDLQNIYLRTFLKNKNIEKFSVSAQTGDKDIVFGFLNAQNQIEIYGTNAQQMCIFITDRIVFTGGMLQGIIDLNSSSIDWKCILLNADMNILTAKILLTLLTSIRNPRANFMPITKANGKYDIEHKVLTFDANATNNTNVIKSDGWVNFDNSTLDVHISFATRSLILRILEKIFQQKQEILSIQNLKINIHGDLHHPSFTKPIISAIFSQLLNIILF